MREIKFRGKDHRTGEWKYGFFVKAYQCLIHEGDIGDIFVVEPNTVGQFTGLLDKNGKEIFEGDVVRLSENPIHEGVLVECVWLEWRTGFVYKFLTGSNEGKFTDMNDTWRKYEILGNRFENPELLKEANE